MYSGFTAYIARFFMLAVQTEMVPIAPETLSKTLIFSTFCLQTEADSQG